MAKLDRFELTDADVLSDAPNFLEQHVKTVTDKFDEACYHAFAQYGYDKDWIDDPENRKRIHGRYNTSDLSFGIPMSAVFYLDNVPLFQVDGTNYTSNYRTIYDFRIRYLAPLGDHI